MIKGIRAHSIKGAVKRLSDITLVDLSNMAIGDIKLLLLSLPIVIEKVSEEKKRREVIDSLPKGKNE